VGTMAAFPRATSDGKYGFYEVLSIFLVLNWENSLRIGLE